MVREKKPPPPPFLSAGSPRLLTRRRRYGSAYLLTSCVFQLPSGKLYSRYNSKWVFLIALAVFEVGSLITGVAPASPPFIVGRALQGVGAAGIQAGYLIIITSISPPEKAPVFQSLSGAMFGVAAVVGPLVWNKKKNPFPSSGRH